MILFTFTPVALFVLVLVLGEVFDISFALPVRPHEGQLFWAPEDMFPGKSLEDYRWEEMIREAVRLQLENRPRPDRGTATMLDLDLDEFFELFGDGTF